MQVSKYEEQYFIRVFNLVCFGVVLTERNS